MSRDSHDAIGCSARDGVCHVCSDEAIVGRILQVDEPTRSAVVAMHTRTEVVALDLVEAAVGDTVLVHLGFAIGRLDPP